MRFGLNENTVSKINDTFTSYPEIEQVLIYGSRAKGNFREGSDIDISLFGENLDSTLLKSIHQKIDNLNTPYLFDISIFNDLKSERLIDHIKRVGKILYEKDK